MKHHKYKTTIELSIAGGITFDTPAVVIYKRIEGFAGNRTSPPEPRSIEIERIFLLGKNGVQLELPSDLEEALGSDEELHRILLEEWYADEERAAEYRAEAMMEARWEK